MLVMKSGGKPNLENYSVFLETLFKSILNITTFAINGLCITFLFNIMTLFYCPIC
jgi:hypothetical protein